jgi:hypothetical protein
MSTDDQPRIPPEGNGGFDLSQGDVEILAGALRAIGRGFFLVYVLLFLQQALPVQLRSLGWIQGLISTLINNAPISLGGLGFLFLACVLSPRIRTVRLLLLASRLALPAAVGFLLLLPLQGYVAFQTLLRFDANAGRQSTEAIRQLDTLRDEIGAVRRPEDLRIVLSRLQAPAVERLQGLPLEQARQQLLEGIDRDEAALRSRQRNERRTMLWAAGKASLTNSLLAVVLARVLLLCRRQRLLDVFPPMPMP